MAEPTTEETTTPTTPAKPKPVPTIRIPQAAFKARVEREAAAIVMKRLGVSLEEAEKIVKAGPPVTTSPTNTTSDTALMTAHAALQTDKERLAKENLDLKRMMGQNELKTKREIRRLRDKQIESELRFAASAAGVKEVDFAIHLFAQEAAESEDDVDPASFFTGLQATRPFLFGQAAPAADANIPITTAPPESLVPGEDKPKPAATGTAPPKTNTDEMDSAQFNQHLRSSYGYVPGS